MELVHAPPDHQTESSGPAVAIGNLDGVHRGHQALIASALASSTAAGAQTAVLTFSPHPQEILRPSQEGHRLTTDGEKYALLERYGVDLTLALPFDTAMAELDAEAFFDRYLVRGLRATSLHVGEDFHFGRKRAGNSELLKRLGKAAGIEVRTIAPVLQGKERISSSLIRTLIKQGNLEEANRLLGHAYALTGVVEKGAGRGRQLGVPTANVAYPRAKVAPKLGVYVTRAIVGDRTYASVSNFGMRPTFDGGDLKPTLETHLLDFQGSLYDQVLEVELLACLREERRFDGVEALRTQVLADIDQVRKRKIVPGSSAV